MGQHAADVVQHESEAGMLQDRAVGLLQDVAQVRLMVVANPADVRVQPRLPGPVAHLAGELSDVLRVARRLAAVESLQPARTAHLPQVRGEFAVVDGRPGNEEHFGLHASHGTRDYREPPTAAETVFHDHGRFAPQHRAPRRDPRCLRDRRGAGCRQVGARAVASGLSASARAPTSLRSRLGSGIGRAPHTIEEQIDMTLFQRAHDIVQAKANKALDAAEKPDEMLDLSYEQMLDQITQVRRGLVDIAAARKQIELQEQQLQHSVDHLQDQARAALSQGNEDLAKEALSRKAAAQAQIDAMDPQHQQLTEEEEKLEHTLAALQKRVNDFRTQKEVLKAQYTAAQAETSIGESAAGISKTFGDSGAELQRAQDKIATMQARAGAVDELIQSGVLEDVGGDTDDIQKELDEAGSAAEVDKELAALKAEIGPGSPAPPELTAG